jgi:fluoride exporter
MMNYLIVAAGSAIGGMGRYYFTGLAARLISDVFPWGTLLINVGGSFVIGVLAAFITNDGAHPFVAHELRLLLMIGVCGGFTTFSSFSLETLNLARNGEWLAAGGYIAGSFVLCLAVVAVGYFSAAALQR